MSEEILHSPLQPAVLLSRCDFLRPASVPQAPHINVVKGQSIKEFSEEIQDI